MVDTYSVELDTDGLHRNLGGGIPSGALVLVVGAFGAGKSAICQRLLFGFLRNHHSATYISTEFTMKGFIEQMKSLNYNSVDYLLNKELLYIPVFPLIGKHKKRDDFLSLLVGKQHLYERDIIIVDTFSALVKYDIDQDRVLDVLAFFKKLTGKGKTIILTVQPDELAEELIRPFKTDSEVYLDIVMASLEGASTRTIQVRRFAGSTKPIVEATGFRIEPKVGFIIDITSVA